MSAGAHFLDPLTPLATILNVRETDEPGEEMGARPRPLHRALERPPEAWLKKALDARSAAEKEEFAMLGLRALDRAEEDDEELRALLLKQSYDALMAMGQTRDALERAEEIIDLGPLGDVARHDAARAAAALGEIEVAADHLRIAAKVAPEERRAFHFGTLGALLRFAGLAEDAREAFKKAERWADADRAIYRAQRALAEGDAGVGPEESWAELRQELEQSPSQKGYALWVLGELCARQGDPAASRSYMSAFLKRLERASPLKCLSLKSEIERAREIVARAG
jgi:tetratricopeptide (TPR) repeat protein